VIRDSETEIKGTIYNKINQILAYADDIVLVARSIDSLKETMRKLMKAAGVLGLTINMQMTKYMEVTKKSTNTKMFKINGHVYERVK
jgi:hypothetical protein